MHNARERVRPAGAGGVFVTLTSRPGAVTMKVCASARVGAAVAALGVLGASTSAYAGGWQVELEGTAPVSCHAELRQQLAPAGGVVNLGPLSEACNGTNGFQVFAATPTGTGGVFLVDGRSIPVSTSGTTQLDATSGAVLITRQVSYDPQGGQSPQRVTIIVVVNW